jgi:N-acetylmuramoyl-L-alanine amidase
MITSRNSKKILRSQERSAICGVKTWIAAWLISLLAGFASMSIVMAAVPDAEGVYNIPEIKVFQLQDRQVVAVAVEQTISGQEIEDVLTYKLVPRFSEKKSANSLEVVLTNVSARFQEVPTAGLLKIEKTGSDQVRFSLSGDQAARVIINTVARKTVKGRDGMIRMRTYLVFTLFKGPKKDIPTVVLDAGHGGNDTGAVKNSIREKDLNLDVTLRLARMFELQGWNVVLTRREDVEPSLLERADAANIVGADVFISIHNNSLPDEKIPRSREFGTTVLYNSSALRPAYDLALLTQNEIVSALGTQREVLQDRPRLVVLNSTWVPAILTEGIMLPNPANAKLVMDRLQRERMAEAIFRAASTWRGVTGSATAKPASAQTSIQTAKTVKIPTATGNNSGNIANHGTVAVKDGWLYYLKKAESLYGEKEETLWRIRPDRLSSDQLVADVEAWDINFAGEWLYYVNWSDEQSIYRARPDGSEAIRLVNGPAQQINIVGESIVYVTERHIYSVEREGGLAIQLLDDDVENVIAVGGWIYYANGNDGFKPYRVRFDGTERTKVVNDETLFMTIADDWIFYSNRSDGEKLYRVQLNGTQREKISDDRVGYLNVDSQFVYYTTTSQGNAIFRIQKNGGAKIKLTEGAAASGPIGIVDKKLYYHGQFLELK